MMYNLVELRQIGTLEYGFCLPVFSKSGSNDAYVQNLDAFGRVADFLPIDISCFPKIEQLPPPLATDIGLLGLLAFQQEGGVLLVMDYDSLREELTGVQISDPFVALEVAALLKSKKLQNAAIQDCKLVLGNGGSITRWANRESKLFRASETMFEKAAKTHEEPQDKFLSDFTKLEKQFGSEDWTETWLKLWSQGYRRNELVGLAAFRLDQGFDFGYDGARIFHLILEFDKSDFVVAHAIKVLSVARSIDEYWRGLFAQLINNSYKRRKELVEIAYSALERALPDIRAGSRQWVSVWNSVSHYSSERRKSWILAAEFVRSISALNANVAHHLVYPYRNSDEEFEPFFPRTREWILQTSRSTVLWSSLFLSVLERDKSVEVVEKGVEWLGQLGGNLTSWKDVWNAYRGLIDERARRELAFSWLARARWNMRSWVEVFMVLLEGSPPAHRRRLKVLGAQWLEAGYGSVASRKQVQQAIRYLESLKGE
jgi:hypothetical protein